MTHQFTCPICNGNLNIDDQIIFSAETESSEKGLIMLSAEIGNYHVKFNPQFKINKGEKTAFFCPVCHANLVASDISHSLARVNMTDNENRSSQVLFSVIKGEQCTFKLQDDTVEAFGDDASEYANFFGEQPHY